MSKEMSQKLVMEMHQTFPEIYVSPYVHYTFGREDDHFIMEQFLTEQGRKYLKRCLPLATVICFITGGPKKVKGFRADAMVKIANEAPIRTYHFPIWAIEQHLINRQLRRFARETGQSVNITQRKL